MSCKNFKVCDTVRIRQDLIGGLYYNSKFPNGKDDYDFDDHLYLYQGDSPLHFAEEMECFRGMETEVMQLEGHEKFYRLKGIKTWVFNDQMLEPVMEINISSQDLFSFLDQ